MDKVPFRILRFRSRQSHAATRKAIGPLVLHVAEEKASAARLDRILLSGNRNRSELRSNGWITNIKRETAETERLVDIAVELGKDDALALGSAGMAVARLLGDLDYGASLIDRALVSV